MTAALSKRQQARNERQLQELLGVPGNGRCADCDTQNPGWASWSLGVFLCVRCASLHRKLGVHVSKVKSLTMDSWSPEQVDNMKKMGNVKSNAIYNPKNVKPDIPIDADEVDGAMERFIRQKYELRSLSTNRPAIKQNTGSTGSGSWNEEPPALPPKPKKFFASFRSASSTNSRQKQDRMTPPLSPAYSSDLGPEVPKKDKPTQVFGMKITGVGNNFDQKLAHLRDMGFSDPRRNSEILKSSNGNLDKAVETLVRLGEGSKPAPPPRTLTPVSMGSSAGAGITVEKTRQTENKVSNNPWDVKPDQPPRSASLPVTQASPPPRSQSADPISNSWNPFLSQPQQIDPQQSLQNNFQSLAISHTGPAQSQQQQSFFQQPSVPQIPQQYQNNPFHPPQTQTNPWPASPPPQQQYTIPQPAQTQAAPAPQLSQPTGNPFFQPVRSFSASPSNPWSAPQAPTMPNQPSPFAPQAQSSPAPALAQQSTNSFGSHPPLQPWQQQQPFSSSPQPMMNQSNYFAQPQPVQSQPQPQQIQPLQSQPTQPIQPLNQNPWQQPQQQQTQPPQSTMQAQVQTQQFGQQQQPFQAQPPRHDKNSILALYNMPPTLQRQPLQTLQEDPNAVPQPQVQIFAPQAPQRSVTMPIQQSMSPFAPMATAAPPITQPQGTRHVSNESVDFVGMGAGQSGRHSPDAFAGLSARYMR